MFIRLMEIILFCFLLGMFATQVLWPFYKGTQWFPDFRKSKKIKDDIVTKKSELQDEDLLDRLDELDTKIVEKREKRKKKI